MFFSLDNFSSNKLGVAFELCIVIGRIPLITTVFTTRDRIAIRLVGPEMLEGNDSFILVAWLWLLLLLAMLLL